MLDSVLSRIPVVASLAYIERVRRLPATFTTSLSPEPGNRYFRHAIAVLVDGEKIGYVAPEVAAGIFGRVTAAAEPWRCPGRRAAVSDHETSGVEILLDGASLPLER